MKKFLLKCAALLLILTSLLYLGSAAYRQTTTWRNWDCDEETDEYYDMPEAIDFAVVGPSHGRAAFRQEDYGDGFFNFSMSSQTPQYDLQQLRQFGGRIQPGATVVLTVSYLSPFWTDTEELFELKQARYYRIFQPQYIVNCDVLRWCKDRWFPLLNTDVRDVLSAVLYPPDPREDSDLISGRQTLKHSDLEKEYARIQKNHLSLVEPAMPDGNPVMLDAYREILALCGEKGWNAVLVTPPYPAVYTNCFSPEIQAAYRRITAQLSEESGVPWLDYSQHADFTENFAYFKDIDHLNLAGAHTFSELVKADLQALGMKTE